MKSNISIEKPVDAPFAWVPSPEFINTTNIAWLMRRVGVASYAALHQWSVQNREAFWTLVIERLGIRFQQPFSRVMDLSQGVETPCWLVGAQFNIVESCFNAPADSPAIIHQAEGGEPKVMTVAELAKLTNRVAANLKRRGFKPGDALVIIMPMTAESVAIYLGIIKAGCVAVGIADSFRPREIAARLRLSQAVAVFTQDVITRGNKKLPLYAHLIEASAPTTIVLPAGENISLPIRSGDFSWNDFLEADNHTAAEVREPSDTINILFSSGTTGESKAIPWTQTTPIKCAMDAHFHQNVQPGDVLVWPTNMGWMMGPWLVFAGLLNRATLGLYYGAPTEREFGTFVQNAKTTLLGVIPGLVKTWRNTGCMKHLDWSAIKVLSSTGECSNSEDMRWLMSRAGGKPIIEYCGGTEIGGGYITGTVTKPCVPGAFNSPALGLDFVVVDEKGKPADAGELFIIPPSIGLSVSLLNQNHDEVYFDGTPKHPLGVILRRHGDEIEKLGDGYWRALGRADDTMNLGGIKISSAEIEEVLQTVPGATEVAAIAVSPVDGPSQLVVYAVSAAPRPARQDELKASMQDAIKRDLNPLFKIHDLILIDALPRTASNKVMRRTLRDKWRNEPPRATLAAAAQGLPQLLSAASQP
jgi:acetyl-CoA synthetase